MPKSETALLVCPGISDHHLGAVRNALHIRRDLLPDVVYLPFGWTPQMKSHHVDERFQKLKHDELNLALEKYDSLVALGVSAGAAVALRLALHEPKIERVVSFDGWINPHDRLKKFPYPGFAHFVEALNQELNTYRKVKLPKLAKRTLLVHQKRDDLVPREAGMLAGAEEHYLKYSIPFSFHAVSTSVILWWELIKGRNSAIWQWILDGKLKATVNQNNNSKKTASR